MPTNPDRERELINHAQHGDRHAFETLINEYYMTIYKIAFKWAQNKENAEDITQNACIKLARSIDSFRFDSNFLTWLYRLVINTAKDWQRMQVRHENIDGINEENYSITESNSEQLVFFRQVMEAIEALPKKEREALILTAIEGLNHSVAGDHLGLAESTISWYIMEGRKKLNSALGAT